MSLPTFLLLSPVYAANGKQVAQTCAVEKNEQMSKIKLAANITSLVVIILIWVKNSCFQFGKAASNVYELSTDLQKHKMPKKQKKGAESTLRAPIVLGEEKDLSRVNKEANKLLKPTELEATLTTPLEPPILSGKEKGLYKVDKEANKLLKPTKPKAALTTPLETPTVLGREKDPPKDGTEGNKEDTVKTNQLSDLTEKNFSKNMKIIQKNLQPDSVASETRPAKKKEDSSTQQKKIIYFYGSDDDADPYSIPEELTYEKIISDESIFPRTLEEEALFQAILAKESQKRKKRLSFGRRTSWQS